MSTNDKIGILMAHKWYHGYGMWQTCRLCHQQIAPWVAVFFSPKGTAYHDGCAVRSKQAEKIFKSLLLTDDELRSIGLL